MQATVDLILPSRQLGNAAWLLKLRWVAVGGQLITICVVQLILEVQLRWMPLLGTVTFTAVTNVAFGLWLHAQIAREPAQQMSRHALILLVGVMTLDLLSLTALLYFSGGIFNPFSVFFFVNLALAAVLLPERWSWTLTLIAIACLTALSYAYVPLEALEPSVETIDSPLPRSTDASGPSSPRRRTGVVPATEWESLPRFGLLISFATCAVVVVYFVTRVTRELRQRERELRVAEQKQARSQRLEALGTLAAGAGHELATPLSTIAVVSKELRRHLDNVDAPQSVFEDVALIRTEVDRCRSILDRMTGNLSQYKDQPWTAVSTDSLVKEILEGLRGGDRVQVSVDPRTETRSVSIPLESTAQAIRGVVQNALDVSDSNQSVELTAQADQLGDCCLLIIRDHGPGMSPDVLSRAGEPFFTTKEPGEGMGLGLFLTRSVIEHLGGSLELKSSQESQGVTAEIRIPWMRERLE